MSLSSYTVPDDINYIAAFLTLSCNLNCSYCINKSGGLVVRRHMTPEQWVEGLSRLTTRDDLPITLQGGEPTSWGGFYKMVGSLPERLPLDLLTNGSFDVGAFMRAIPPAKFGRTAPYAPIRFSYHAETMDALDLLDKVLTMQINRYKVGIWAVQHPDHQQANDHMRNLCESCGVDFRWKEYLAPGHGTYRYPYAVFNKTVHCCRCKTSEIIIDPAGNLFRCHADLYANRNIVGNILDKTLPDFTKERDCNLMGTCNPCDIKTKYDRFERTGHCSVTITHVDRNPSIG